MSGYWMPDAVLAQAKQAQRIYQPKRDSDHGWWFNPFWSEARVNAPQPLALRRARAGVLEPVLKARVPPQLTMDEEGT